jgi:hypothetical protein
VRGKTRIEIIAPFFTHRTLSEGAQALLSRIHALIGVSGPHKTHTRLTTQQECALVDELNVFAGDPAAQSGVGLVWDELRAMRVGVCDTARAIEASFAAAQNTQTAI